MDTRPPAVHSADFAAAWRSVFCSVYRWRREGRFAVVPGLLGPPTLSYLPGLNYSDLSEAEARRLARETAGRPFNIRALTAPQGEPPPGAPAVLRLDLAAFGHDREAVWKQALIGTGRKCVRHARKVGLDVAQETGPAALEALRAMLRLTLKRQGAPLRPTALFAALIDELDGRVLVVRKRIGGEAMAAMLWFRDGPLAWVPWSGARLCAEKPADLLFWGFMESALEAGADIVDFGSSAVGSGPYRFKQKFGADPIPVLWLSNRSADLHSRYAAAMKLWRALPNAVTDKLGPRLCRRLPDY